MLIVLIPLFPLNFLQFPLQNSLILYISWFYKFFFYRLIFTISFTFRWFASHQSFTITWSLFTCSVTIKQCSHDFTQIYSSTRGTFHALVLLTCRKITWFHVQCVIFFTHKGNTHFNLLFNIKKGSGVTIHTSLPSLAYWLMTLRVLALGGLRSFCHPPPAHLIESFFLEALHPIIYSKLGALSLTAPGVLAKYAQANLPNTPCSNQIYLVRGTFKDTVVSHHVTLWLEYRQAKKKIIQFGAVRLPIMHQYQ